MMRPLARMLTEGDGGEFVPHAPKTTKEAEQRGWYNSKSGADYTVFYWPAYQVYTVHDANLEPVPKDAPYVGTSEKAAIDYIQKTLDADYVAPVTQLTPTQAFSRAIEASNDVDTWLGDAAVLNHNGDWIRLYWPIEDQGAAFYISYELEKGDPSGLPPDRELVLMPGQRETIYNTESGDLKYNVRVRYTGVVDLEPAGTTVKEAPASRGPLFGRAGGGYLFNGPIMSRLRALRGG